MSLFGLIPPDVSGRAAIALCLIAFVSGLARGFSGFGSALIFMPLASSIAAPRLVAALLLIIDFVGAAPLLPNAWREADRKATAIIVLGALIGVPIGTYLLTELDSVTTRWIISVFVAALLALLLSGWRYRGKDHVTLSMGIGALSGFCSGLAQTGGPPIVGYWLGRPVASAVARANILLFFWRVRFLFCRQLRRERPDHDRCHQVLARHRSGLRHRRQIRRLTVRPRQRGAVPGHLLRPDRARRHLRPARARRRTPWRLEHDPEKCVAVFRKDHAQTKR
jgi:hypothetical protein